MKKLMVLAAMLAMALVVAVPAFAQPTHPFCGSGQEYAQEHVVVLAQSGKIKAPQAPGEYVHNPGIEHQGFKVCEPPPG
jgi:hypothetical protein